MQATGDTDISGLFTSGNYHNNAAGKRQTAKKRRQRNGLPGFGRSLERAKIENFFTGSVCDAMVGKRQGAGDNEDESYE